MTSTDQRPGPRAVTAALLVVPVVFLAVFFVLPVVSIVVTGLRPDGRWDLSGLGEVISDDGLRRVAWFTFWQAAVSTALTLIVALPGAYVLARLEFRGRSLFRALVVIPFVLPTVVVGTAFLALLGPTGPLASVARSLSITDDFDLRRTTVAVIAAHVFFNYAVVARTVGSAWSRLDPATEDAARVLGAGRWRTFRSVSLPQLMPAIGGAAAIVFLFSFTSFGVVKILGGARLATLEVEIHRQTTQLLDLPTAAALAIVQLAAVGAALGVHGRVAERHHHTLRLRPASTTARRPRGADRLVLGATLTSALVLLATPVLVLVERSFATADGYGLAFYRSLSTTRRGSTAFVPPTEALRNSAVFAGSASLIALAVGGLAAFGLVRLGRRGRRLVDSGLMLPLGTSAVTIGFGFLITLDDPPLDLRTSALLIPLAQALIAVPFVVRTLVPALRAIDERLRDAAAVLGASPARIVREVDLPIVARPLLVALGFAYAISLGEFGATVFIARADAPTIPVMIFRVLAQPGAVSVGQAMALSTILMTLTAVVMLVVDRFRAGEVGSF